jgi:hypothetical protein
VIKSLCESWATEDRPFAVKHRASTLFLDVADFTEQTGKFAACCINDLYLAWTSTLNNPDPTLAEKIRLKGFFAFI